MYVHVLYDTVRSRCDFDDTADVVPISYRRMSTNEKKCVYVINISTERHYFGILALARDTVSI